MAQTIAEKKAKKRAKRKAITAEKNKKLKLLKQERDLNRAIALNSQGYLKVSNKHCMLSRLDREDWKEHMAITHTPWSAEEGMSWVECLDNDAEDHYRRCYSEDKITVPEDVYKLSDKSGWNTIGFKIL